MNQLAPSSVDLHCHSTASDGLLTPAGLLAYASERGVSTIALTDHDSTNGVAQAMAVGAIGCSVGRNIFMHDHPEAITRALSRVIRERWSADKALAAMQEETA